MKAVRRGNQTETKRRWQAAKTCAGMLTAAALAMGGHAAMAQNFSDVKPAPQQLQWQDLQFGVIIHFGTNTFLDREWGDGTASPQTFNPKHFDPDQWMKAIKASGAKYVVMVAKHHDGFCLWPTEQTDYSIKASPFMDGKGDIVGAVAKAARANGLGFGIYLSPWDRHDPRYKDKDTTEYDKYYQSELEELVTKYGDLTEFWLDGAGSGGHVYNFPKIIETLRTYQPNTVVFADTALFEYGDARWVGTESGFIDYENWNVIDRHGYLRWRPIEADTPLHKLQWFWHPNSDETLRSLDDLVNSWENSVGHGGQWMLGVAPNKDGLLPEADVKRLKELGDTLRARYSNNLAERHQPVDANTAKALDGDRDTFWSAPEGSRSATLEVRFAHPETIDHALTMEWLNDGQLIQQYKIEAWKDGKWVPVVSDYAIGHMKIDRFPAVTTDRVRLNIVASAGQARIREFQLFRIDGAETQTAMK
ncbi:alpha-L-fucosidase [Silvibacterium sp.]|uniref:alpha-L-fucosidase n=1 Tax=Silvibacterium sp. TaxID=1964179 RepID=UPI0039E4F6AE